MGHVVCICIVCVFVCVWVACSAQPSKNGEHKSNSSSTSSFARNTTDADSPPHPPLVPTQNSLDSLYKENIIPPPVSGGGAPVLDGPPLAPERLLPRPGKARDVDFGPMPEYQDEVITRIIHQQLELCPFTPLCHHGPMSSLPPHNNNRAPCCSHCSCHDCTSAGSCCPDLHMDVIEQSEFRCVIPQLKKLVLNKLGIYSIMMVSGCHSDFQNDDYKRRCYESLDIDIRSDLSIMAPVESILTGKLFKNKYCALCNNVDESDTEAWIPWLDCKFGTTLPSLTSESFVSFMSETNECDIVFKPPETSRATIESCPDGAITSCNETGLWEIYDHVIDRGCNSFLSWYNRTYRNVFCYICNANGRPDGDSCHPIDPPQHVPEFAPPLFSKLLDYADGGKIIPVDSECISGHIWDPYQVMPTLY